MLHWLKPELRPVSARASRPSSEPMSQLCTRSGSIGRVQEYVR